MTTTFEIDASDLKRHQAKLREAVHRAHVEVEKTLPLIGEEIAEAARKIAGEHGSTSIPSTIKVVPMPGAYAVLIRAGGAGNHIAGLWEKGNKGAKQSAKTFRHPVFGNKDVWVEQPRHRFFMPARIALHKKTTEQLSNAWLRALKIAGMHEV